MKLLIGVNFVSDLVCLEKIYSGKLRDTIGISLYPIDRLTSLGLVNTTMKSIVINNGSNSRTDKYVNLTAIGGKFYQTINNKRRK